MPSIETRRQFLKPREWSEWDALDRDEAKGVPAPPLQKPYPPDAALVDLVDKAIEARLEEANDTLADIDLDERRQMAAGLRDLLLSIENSDAD